MPDPVAPARRFVKATAGRALQADVVVVGAGVAGLRTALALAPLAVTVVTKTAAGRGGSTEWAQGGISAALGSDDSSRLHSADTLQVSGGIGDRAVTDLVTAGAAAEILAMRELGARFDTDPDGELTLGREAGHSRSRIVHAGGDRTGAEVLRVLTAEALAAEHIRFVERSFVRSLLTDGDRVSGVEVACDGGDEALVVNARAVVLATGGLGRLYRFTTNPLESTGDGMALAARAGAELADLEFVQFHPTALDAAVDPLPLLTEALRGAGAPLIDERGERFLLALHRDAELAPRDFVARSIWRHQQEGHRVFLDLRGELGANLAGRFPTAYRHATAAGLDPAHEPLPVTPAAHYAMGGVAIDSRGRTSVAGLWACGEVASSGLHGSNRLASNSLIEAMVLGKRTAADLRATLRCEAPRPQRHLRGSWSTPDVPASAELRLRLRSLMWRQVGLERDASGLRAALQDIDELDREAQSVNDEELANMLEVGSHIAAAALARRESRGSHVRRDHPFARDGFARRSVVRTDPERAALSVGRTSAP